MFDFTNNEKLFFLYLKGCFKRDDFFYEVYRNSGLKKHEELLFSILANDCEVEYGQTNKIDKYKFYEKFYVKCLTNEIIDTRGKSVIDYLVGKMINADMNSNYIRIENILEKEIGELKISNKLETYLKEVDVSYLKIR